MNHYRHDLAVRIAILAGRTIENAKGLATPEAQGRARGMATQWALDAYEMLEADLRRARHDGYVAGIGKP